MVRVFKGPLNADYGPADRNIDPVKERERERKRERRDRKKM